MKFFLIIFIFFNVIHSLKKDPDVERFKTLFEKKWLENSEFEDEYTFTIDLNHPIELIEKALQEFVGNYKNMTFTLVKGKRGEDVIKEKLEKGEKWKKECMNLRKQFTQKPPFSCHLPKEYVINKRVDPNLMTASIPPHPVYYNFEEDIPHKVTIFLERGKISLNETMIIGSIQPIKGIHF